jgi:hypothetical protein
MGVYVKSFSGSVFAWRGGMGFGLTFILDRKLLFLYVHPTGRSIANGIKKNGIEKSRSSCHALD